ncbi:hypothetical protein JDW19_01565 [Paenibacillus polymyxa]|uniref:Uncharacterized protein n=1 Tax=Paenibacillus polymyxa TaxID=1406 RepID=A0A8I1J1K1_PAEPO|nr:MULTISPECIES: hypothetical protein [Paenibacillus]KAF6576725.1 hypothetical protein G9G53_02110 [Paenibacillus sp. EKM206P]KAF6591141.1 hypothetical protein G9G52_01855 [Paenibacillus sp. EKM205P]MBM0631821.1 hypothetical protein [Paenibacillus polymyxa]
MQSKKLLIPIALLLLIQLSVPICYTFAQDNLVIDHETKERFKEQYGLEGPQSPILEQQQNILFGGDWGFSPSADAVMLELTIWIRNPLIFISQQLIYSVKS